MNHFPPATFAAKPVGVVSYSLGRLGGSSVSIQLREYLTELAMINLPIMVSSSMLSLLSRLKLSTMRAKLWQQEISSGEYPLHLGCDFGGKRSIRSTYRANTKRDAWPTRLVRIRNEADQRRTWTNAPVKSRPFFSGPSYSTLDTQRLLNK